MEKTFDTLISNKKFQSFVFFSIIVLLSVSIHSESSDWNYFMSLREKLGSISPIVVLAFIPYWIIKLFYGIYLKMTKGSFVWINNRLLYLVPLIIWIALMYIMYAPEYASQSEWEWLFN